MNQTVKAVIFWAAIVVSATLLWQIVRSTPGDRATTEISYSSFLTQIDQGQIRKVVIAGNVAQAYDTKGDGFRVVVPTEQSGMVQALLDHSAEIWYRDANSRTWPSWVLNFAPLVFLAALWFFMIRQMRSANRRRADEAFPSSPAPTDSQSRFGP